MKIQSYILLIFSLLLCSCEDTFQLLEGAQFTDNPHSMLADKTSLTFNYGGYCTSQDHFEGKIEVYTTFTTWKVTNIPSWIEVSPTTGGWASGRDLKVVHIDVSKNTTINSRSATIHIVSTSPGYNKDIPITVTQTGEEAYVSFSKTSLSVYEAGTTATITVSSNTTWRASTSDSWIHVENSQSTTGNGKINITIDANDSYATRNGEINVSYYTGDTYMTQSISVRQYYW